MFKHPYKQPINIDGIEFELFDVHKCQPIAIVSLLAFSSIMCFTQRLKCETYNDSVSLHFTLLATLFVTGGYEQCCTRLLKVLHKCCNTDVLGVLLIYPHLCIYISQTPCYLYTVNNKSSAVQNFRGSLVFSIM